MQNSDRDSHAASTGLWCKLIAGAPVRKTRFHDQLGRRIGLGRALRNGPRALVTGIGRLALGLRPKSPWISYDAQVVIAGILRPSSRVLEFGSGMSTIWFAQRAGHVVSIEDDRTWYEAVRDRLPAGKVEYRFASGCDEYLAAVPNDKFDLIMIDGHWRDQCARFAVEHLAAGGSIYLDNSDNSCDPVTGDMPAAVRLLTEFANSRAMRIREFTDFAPTQLFVQRGLLIGG